MDNGRCRLHGGASTGGGAPRGNQNARKHGGYSALVSSLDDEERAEWGQITTDTGTALDNEIRFAEIRQRRILRFIRDKMGGTITPQYETALSGITAAKLRAIEAKHRADTERGGDEGEIDSLFSALGGSDDYLTDGDD